MSTTASGRETGDRAAFLAKVAARNERTTTPRLLDGDGVADAVSYTADLSDLMTAFVAAATAHGATVYAIHRDADHVAAVIDIATNLGLDDFVIADEPTAREFGSLLEQAGASTRAITAARDLTADDTVVTAVSAGIALTGSIALSSGARGSRPMTTLPMTHVALLEAATIVATPREVYRGFAGSTWPGSSLTIATGPSRSSDIERQITLGVHGPGKVIIVVDARR